MKKGGTSRAISSNAQNKDRMSQNHTRLEESPKALMQECSTYYATHCIRANFSQNPYEEVRVGKSGEASRDTQLALNLNPGFVSELRTPNICCQN